MKTYCHTNVFGNTSVFPLDHFLSMWQNPFEYHRQRVCSERTTYYSVSPLLLSYSSNSNSFSFILLLPLASYAVTCACYICLLTCTCYILGIVSVPRAEKVMKVPWAKDVGFKIELWINQNYSFIKFEQV